MGSFDTSRSFLFIFAGEFTTEERRTQSYYEQPFYIAISLHRFNLCVLLSSVVKMKIKALNDEKSKEINDRDEQVRKKEMAFSEKNSELILRESNVLIKESEIDEREEKLKKKQEQDEKDFQMKEDKMEAQQRVISQREKSVSERENSVDVKENEVAQKSAEYGKKLVLLDSLIDDVQSYKSPVSVAKNVLEILKESMNEKGKRVTSDMIGVLTRNTDMLNRKYQAKINETRVKREQIQQGTYFDMSDEQDERGDRSL